MFLLKNKNITKLLSEQKLRETIIDNIPAQIFWKNTELIYMGCNQTFIDALGLKSKEDVIGKTDYDLPVSEIDSSSYRADDMEVIKTRKPKLHIEEQQTFKDGSKKIISTSKVPLYDEAGNVCGILAIYFDVTKRKKIELDLIESKAAAEAANQAKTEFLENMRHDIRTPLSGIVGFSDMLMQETSDPKISNYANNLVASSHALLNLLDEVLEAVRIGSGEIPFQKKKFHLKNTVNSIIELNQSRAAQKQIDLSINFDTNLPQYVIGDKIRLHRIILELVSNALSFTDSGFVKLTVLESKRTDEKLILKIIVADSGIGIPRDKQEEIYLHFKRLSPSYKGLYKGNGLGLAVVKQFIDELSGEIYVQSETGKGTTFTCLIPLQLPLIDDSLGAEENEGLNDSFLKQSKLQNIMNPLPLSQGQYAEPNKSFHHNVLLVEDNALAQLATTTILQNANLSVDLAKTGEEALELIAKNTYDLIFMDIGLPGIDGYEVTQRIRSNEQHLKKKMPIIALTAHVGEENKLHCITAGMDAVLAKPLTNNLCKEILNTYLSDNKVQLKLPESENELFELHHFALFDIAVGIQTLGSDQNLRELLKNTIDDCLKPDMLEIQDAYHAKNYEKVSQIAHRIQGGAMYIGAIQLQQACYYLENYRTTTTKDLFIRLYQQLLEVMQRTEDTVTNWLESKID